MKKYLSFALLFTALFLVSCRQAEEKYLVILHTNDTHSQLFPMENARQWTGYGGAAKRLTLIKGIRRENKNVLLLDAGDFSQGTPYFNFWKGRLEFEVMNRMEYDGASIGNHEYDNGSEGLLQAYSHSAFPLLNANYDFSGSALNGSFAPCKIFDIDGIRVGVIGLTINLKGLIFEKNCPDLLYLDPIGTTDKFAAELKKQGCDFIICLSHLGIEGDRELAASSRGVDLIIGGHSHTIIENGERLKNAEGREVLIVQTGDRGKYLGRVDVKLKPER